MLMTQPDAQLVITSNPDKVMISKHALALSETVHALAQLGGLSIMQPLDAGFGGKQHIQDIKVAM